MRIDLNWLGGLFRIRRSPRALARAEAGVRPLSLGKAATPNAPHTVFTATDHSSEAGGSQGAGPLPGKDYPSAATDHRHAGGQPDPADRAHASDHHAATEKGRHAQ